MLARSAPLKAGKPLQRKAPMRSKRKSGYKPAVIRFHMNRVAELGCLVSRAPATLHHVTSTINGGRTITRSDKLIVPLAPRFHLIQHGPRESVEALGHRGFYLTHGFDLFAEAVRLWAETVALWEAMHGKGSL